LAVATSCCKSAAVANIHAHRGRKTVRSNQAI
jgi:hypothetical protein